MVQVGQYPSSGSEMQALPPSSGQRMLTRIPVPPMQQQDQPSLPPLEHQPSPQPAQIDWRERLGFMDQMQERKEKTKRITVDDQTGNVHLYAGQDHDIMVAGPSTTYTLGGSAFAFALLLVIAVGFFVRYLSDSPNLGEISKEADSTSTWTLPDVAITVAAAVDQASFCMISAV